jgi:predicted kinase
LPDGITTFDCIEFNRDLRFTDVFADVGFLTMDLIEKGHHELSAHFLNRYLECSGDYGGIVLLDFYFVYRCLVRAKVAAIRSRERESASNRDADIREARDYCALARRQATKGPRALIIMSGLSGSGKTWLAERLMAALPAIRLRSDIERKRLFGLAESERSDSAIAAGIYTAEASAATYEHLFDLAGPILEAGHHVILDAAFLQMEQRNAARASALDAGCSPVLVRADAPAKVLRDRIRKRAALKTTVSEADLEVLEHQLATEQPPTADEHAIVVDNSGAVDVEQLASIAIALSFGACSANHSRPGRQRLIVHT